MSHDPMCPVGPIGSRCQCHLIRTIRADEREHTAFLHEALLRNQLADLRAKVKSLPGSPNSALDWVLRADVLALIDGSSDD